ncbi:MAG: hypothetical protein EAZ92_01145 [Candidatus Kapaibacterium sp.]|nr:MAG: hypothetical protein EAZ92_01145 [Candidatus Kapabacteria bacterium]
MKRLLFLILIASVVGVIAFLGFKLVRGNAEKERIQARIQTLPEFRFTTLSGQTFTDRNIPDSMPVAIIHFLPDCHYCQGEAREIARNSKLFGTARILMVSMASTEEIRAFGREYGIDTLQSVTLLADTEKNFGNTFGTVNVPVTFAYSAQHRLAKQFSGETSAQALYKALSSISERSHSHISLSNP